MKAYDLRVENLTTPLGVDVPLPRLSWRLDADGRAAEQRAYRVTVVPEAASDGWSTGWVESDQTAGVACEPPLEPSSRYLWQVDLRDGDGIEYGPFASWFETGLGDPASHGAWIGRDRFADRAVFDPPTDDDLSSKVRHLDPPCQLRRDFTVASPVLRARLYLTARGVYRAYLNGERVGDDELAPGWTDYRDRICYQSHDVTALLTEGDNAIGIQLADGWYAGYIGFDAKRQGNHYGAAPMAWAMLVVEHADGARTEIVTDGSWREASGAIRYSDLLMGEYVDRRLDLGDWARPGYDDRLWTPVAELDSDLSTLVGIRDEPIRAIRTLPAVSRSFDPEGRALYDFGQNLVGRVRVQLRGLRTGDKVVLRHGEMLTDERLYTANLRTAEATDVVIADRSDVIFEPAFTIHGFRYLEITGASPEVSEVSAVVLHNDLAWAGSLRTSSAPVNQLVSNIEWGLRGNYVAVPTDCPQRDERLGWLADAQVFLPTGAYLADLQAFVARWLGDVRHAQTDQGSFVDVAPMVTNFFGDGAPAWADAGVIIPWHLYRTYGDRRVLEESFGSMARYVDFLVEHNPDLVWTHRVGKHYGDWLQVNTETPRPVLATAYLARSLDLVARAAAVVAPDRADHYAGLAASARAAFCTHFVATDATIEGDTQTDYLLALAFDLVPDGLRPAIADHLVRTVEAVDRLLTTGFVGVSLLCPVLSAIGRDDLAFALLETDRYPSWLYSVKHGATTIWERWDGWTEDRGFQSVEMNSFNHYSLGSVGEWLYRFAAGIDQADGSVGFDVVRYQPRVGGSITEVTATHTVVRGEIRSSWRRDGNAAEFRLTLPPSVRAEALLPASAWLEVDGRELPVGPFTLGPGTHVMRVRGLTA